MAIDKLPLELTEEQNLEELVAVSDLVFVGLVQSLGKPPQNWSGYLTEYQTVNYRVERVLKGKHTTPEIAVDHVVVSGSKTASDSSPGLSHSLFSANTRLIVFARKTKSGAWKSLDENYGAAPATTEWTAKVEGALKK